MYEWTELIVSEHGDMCLRQRTLAGCLSLWLTTVIHSDVAVYSSCRASTVFVMGGKKINANIPASI